MGHTGPVTGTLYLHLFLNGTGSSSEISASKIMKITVVRKNRVESVSRAAFCGSNPYSNVDVLLGLHYFSLRL